MRMRWWSLACLCGLVAGTLRAEERHLEFLNGLRELRYYDYALVFLDQLEARKDLDADLKEVLPYERARTLLDGAQYAGTPEAMLKQLESASGYLQQFVKSSPNHPKAAEANAELAEVLVRKGRVEILQARSPANSPKKAEFMTRARQYFNEARAKYQEAFDLYKRKLADLPQGFIDQKDPKFREREDALISQIQAEYHLYLCTYDEAQTYEPSDPKRNELLLKAANDFEKMHQKHRSVVAGLYARMHQGKCFEEMGGITKALGIYNELLGHGEQESDETLKRLQNHVLHFKLICLNHDDKKDHQVVTQLATDWIKANRDRVLRSPTGLGIRWERGRSLEQLGIKAAAQSAKPKVVEKPKKPVKKKEGEEPAVEEPAEDVLEEDLLGPDYYYRLALADAQYINRFPGEYREPSSAMLKRLDLALGRSGGDPRSFDSAFQLTRELVKPINTKRDAAAKAAGAERERLLKEYADHVNETIRICKLAMSLNGPVSADRKQDRQSELNRVQYFLAFAYFSHPSRSYSYDAGLIGEYIARKYPDVPGSLDAAYLAMAAWQQAYGISDAAKRAAVDPIKSIEESKTNYEIRRVIGIADFIAQKWPNDDKAQDARINLGNMFLKIRQPVEAAKVFQQVPLGTTQYLDARLKAGIAMWDAAASNAMFPDDQKLSPEDVQKYTVEARKILEESIQQQEAKQAAEAKPGDAITAAKFSLVQILNGSGEYAAAVKLITEGPKSVLVGAAEMPGKGGKTIQVATRTELLRGYVGLKQVDMAREQLKELEKLGGTEGLTGILVSLGKELKKEIERLDQTKDPRLSEVLQSFEAFLGDLAARKDGQDFNSLLWVGQTYFSLGEGVEKNDPAKGATYFSGSGNAYQAIMDNAKTNPQFIPADAGPGVTLRLIGSRRREKKFDEAYKLMKELLKQTSNDLSIQTEAAQIFQDRAARGGPDDWKDWSKALAGEPPTLWGWYTLAEKLDANLAQGRLPQATKTEYEFKKFDARYNVAYCRLQFARNQPKDADKEKQFRYAKSDLVNTAAQSEAFGDRPEYAKFNELYQTAQQEYNDLLSKMNRAADARPIVDLEKTSSLVKPGDAQIAEAKAAARPKSKAKKKAAAKPSEAEKPPESASTLMVVLGLLGVLVLGGGGAFLVFRKPQRKKRLVEPETPNLPSAPPVAQPKPPGPPKKARTKAT